MGWIPGCASVDHDVRPLWTGEKELLQRLRGRNCANTDHDVRLEGLHSLLVPEEGVIGVDDARAVVWAEPETAERVGQDRIATSRVERGRRGSETRRFPRTAHDDPSRLSRNLGGKLIEAAVGTSWPGPACAENHCGVCARTSAVARKAAGLRGAGSRNGRLRWTGPAGCDRSARALRSRAHDERVHRQPREQACRQTT